MPLRRRDARDRLTFELVESADGDADGETEDGPRGRTSWGAASGPVDRPDAAVPPVPPGLQDSHDSPGLTATPDPEEAPDAAADAPDDDAASPTDGSPPRRGRRAAVVAAAGVALVLGGMLAVDAWHGRVDLDRLRAAPGGVEPLTAAPVERWTADVGTLSGLAFLPGTIVVVEDGDAVAYSLDSGEENWRVEVGAYATCGNPIFWSLPWGTPDPTLVCVTPVLAGASSGLQGGTELTIHRESGRVEADAWTVTVLDEGGAVLGRRDTTSDGGIPTPGPGGTLVRAERVGEVPAGEGAVIGQDVTTGELRDIPTGRPAVVHVEDALTGDARWEADLPFVERTGQCFEWSETDGEETYRAALESLWIAAETRLLRVEGCGVTAWFTPDGARLDDVDNPSDGVVARGDGTYYRDPSSNDFWGSGSAADTGAAPAVLEADGSVRWEPPGQVLVPASTDGSPAPVLVRYGIELAAFDEAGTELWRTADVGTPQRVLVATSDTVVLSNGFGEGPVLGLDAATGRERWSFGPEEAAALDVGPSWGTDTAYTDGVRAILVVSDWESGEMSFVALDLSDGRVAWTTKGSPNGTSWAAPFQGRLLRIGEDELTRLG